MEFNVNDFSEFTKKIEDYYLSIAKQDAEDYTATKEYDEMTSLQVSFLQDLSKFVISKAKDMGCSETSEVVVAISDIFHYVIDYSLSGNAIVSVSTEEKANKVAHLLFEHAGEALLEYPEVYQAENNQWDVDVIFGGYFVPSWDETGNYIKSMREELEQD